MKMLPYCTFLLCQEQNVVSFTILLEHNIFYLVSALECTMDTNYLSTLVVLLEMQECEIFQSSSLNFTIFINFFVRNDIPDIKATQKILLIQLGAQVQR